MGESENSNYALTIPTFRDSSELILPLDKTREGERRLLEAKDVNPITYVELESAYNEAYRELKRHLATIGFQITKAETAVEIAKSDFLIDEYPAIIQALPSKSMDNADFRKAHLMRDTDFTDACDRVNMLKAMEALIDGKIKVFERTCAFMKKRMDLILRSGLGNDKLYK